MGTVLYDGQIIEYSDEYSHKGQISSWRDKNIPPGTVIYNTHFSKEIPDTKVFPDNMTDVTFYNCNLDNVVLPTGNIYINHTPQRRYKCQNDLMDWEIDETDKPIRPLCKTYFEDAGYSQNPVHIPVEKISSISVLPTLEDIQANRIHSSVKIKGVNYFDPIPEVIE